MTDLKEMGDAFREYTERYYKNGFKCRLCGEIIKSMDLYIKNDFGFPTHHKECEMNSFNEIIPVCPLCGDSECFTCAECSCHECNCQCEDND